MNTRFALILALGASLALSACDGGKGAAEAALNTAQTAFEAAKTEAAAFVPEETNAIETSLAAARTAVANGEYAQALTQVQELTPKISELTAAAAAKKTELTESWGRLSADLPAAVSSIQSRVDELAKTRRLPAGLTTEAVAAAKGTLETITATWSEATTAFANGNVMEAVTKAQTVKGKAAEAMTALGMPVPDVLK